MKKIVLFHLNSLGYGGTEKAVFTFIKNIDKKQYQPKLFFYTDYKKFDYYRRKFLSYFSNKHKKSFHQRYRIYFARYDDFISLVGKQNFFVGDKNDFLTLLKSQKIDILHFNRGETNEFFTQIINDIPKSIKIVETNIFGRPANKDYLNRLSAILFVSKWLKNKAKWSDSYNSIVIYNPISFPKSKQNLKNQYNISDDKIVLGRISRPNMDEGDFIIDVFHNLGLDNVVLLVVAGHKKFKEKAKKYNNIICIEPTSDEIFLSKFYNTLDILLHYRKAGETFGMNIAEAMIHKKPVVSHYSEIDNAQAELLLEGKPSGYVVENNNMKKYIEAVKTLIFNTDLKQQMGKNAYKKAIDLYCEKTVSNKLAKIYSELFSDKNL